MPPDSPNQSADPGQPSPNTNDRPIPPASLARFTLYLRELQLALQQQDSHLNSVELGKRLHVSAAVVRRDLSLLGSPGRRGVGYDVKQLIERIHARLGSDQTWNVMLVGAGNLGTALIRYRGFGNQGFQLVAAVDIDPKRIGKRIGEIEIHDFGGTRQLVKQLDISLAIIAVPATAAATVAQRLTDAGISGILNFAPTTLPESPNVAVANVDLA
ncbi:MAG: redox-sensing transcriptional repressor Rex, partial [Planctomycetota bacterium]